MIATKKWLLQRISCLFYQIFLLHNRQKYKIATRLPLIVEGFLSAKLCKAVLISMFCCCLHDSLSQGQPRHLLDFYLYRLLRQDQNGSNNNKESDDQPDDELPCYKSRSFHRQVIQRSLLEVALLDGGVYRGGTITVKPLRVRLNRYNI